MPESNKAISELMGALAETKTGKNGKVAPTTKSQPENLSLRANPSYKHTSLWVHEDLRRRVKRFLNEPENEGDNMSLMVERALTALLDDAGTP